MDWIPEGLAALLDTVGSALRFATPGNASDFWSMVEGLAAIGVGYFAWRIARSQYEFELLPVLHVDNSGTTAHLQNIGRGVAMDVYEIVQDRAKLLTESIGPGKAVPFNAGRLTKLESHSVYYTNVYGKWFRLKLLNSQLTGGNTASNVHGELRRVGLVRNRLPWSLRREYKRRTRSVQEFMADLGNPWKLDFWQHNYRRYRTPFRLAIGKWWGGIGEQRRLKQFEKYRMNPLIAPTIQDADAWPLSVATISQSCWHSSVVEIDQYDCQWLPEGGFACNVVRRLPWGDVAGLFVVRSATWQRNMGTPRDQRNAEYAAQLVSYVCTCTPDSFFVCVV